MPPININDLVLFSDSSTVYQVVLINYIKQTITLQPIFGDLRFLGNFTIKFSEVKKCQVLGNIKTNPLLQLLYGKD